MLERRVIAVLGGFALATSGCYAGDDVYYYDDGTYDDGYCAPGFAQSDIDSGSKLELDPGVGAGVTAEYLGDGAWRFATACDTALSGYPCSWDILVSAVDGEIEHFDSESLERTDVLASGPSVQGGPDDAVRLVATNDYDLDAFTLDATPGATLEIDTILDEQCGGSYVHWLDAGRVVSAQTQTVDLTPSSP
jgi:hypothetical protein